MATTIITKFGSGAPTASDVVRGELAVDTENGRLYTENIAGSVVEIGLNPSGNVDVTGTVTADGLTVDGNATISVSDNSDNLTLISTDTDANAGPNLLFKRDNNSAAGDDLMGSIVFQGEDAGNNLTDYVAFKTQIQDPTGGSEDGRLKIELMSGGTSRSLLDASGSNAIVFNEDGQALNFRVESSGNANMLFVDGTNDRVGIGTSPSAGLDVVADTNPVLKLDRGSANTANANLYYNGTLTGQLSAANADFQISAAGASTPISFYTNGTRRLLIDSTGTLEIPNQNAINEISFTGTEFTNVLSATTSGFQLGTTGAGYLAFLTSNSEAARIDASGNLGINQSNPSTTLHVGDGSDADRGVVTIEGAGGEHLIFSEASTHPYGANAFAIRPASGTSFIIQEDGASTPAVVVDTSGNLLVGKDALNIGTVGTEVRSNGQLVVTADADNPVDFNRKTSDGVIALFRKDGTTVGSIGVSSFDLTIQSSASGHNGLRFGDAWIAPIATDRSLDDGTTDLGLSGARFKDLYLSGGVYVGGTAAANKLDDYEEGTWTGTLTGGTTAPSSTQQATGYYTKIGELVTLNIVFSNKDVTGVAGTIKVTGLPFTSRATSVSGNTTQGSGWCGRVASATNSVMPFINSSNEIIFVDSFGNGVSWASAGTGTYAGITISFMV
jgi:hypothetical protein